MHKRLRGGHEHVQLGERAPLIGRESSSIVYKDLPKIKLILASILTIFCFYCFIHEKHEEILSEELLFRSSGSFRKAYNLESVEKFSISNLATNSVLGEDADLIIYLMRHAPWTKIRKHVHEIPPEGIKYIESVHFTFLP